MRMFLLPIKHKPFETNVSSFGYIAQTNADGEKDIIGIIEGSPAEQNGLKVRDLIIRETYEGTDIVHLVLNYENGEQEVVLKKAMLLPEIN